MFRSNYIVVSFSCIYACGFDLGWIFTVYPSLTSIWISIIPVNICWSSRRLEEVDSSSQLYFWQEFITIKYTIFKNMSSRRLQNVFSVTIFRLPRRLEDVLKTSWKTKNCYAEDVLKTSWRYVFKTSWRCLVKTY